MAHGTKKDEDMPDGMIVATAVMGKKVCAYGIEYTFEQQHQQGGGRQALYYWLGNKDYTPSHNKIEGEGETGVTPHGKYLIECSSDDNGPLDREDKPA